MTTPKAIVSKLLANSTNLDVVKELVAENATYISLNQYHPDLTKIEPWAGTHSNAGPQAIYQTFLDVNRFWKVEEFKITTVFGEGSEVAVFGTFKYRSVTLGKVTASPFAVYSKVENGKIIYMQFMEDTLSTANSFKKSGQVVYASNPDGGEVVID